jgi:hypothetical protein
VFGVALDLGRRSGRSCVQVEGWCDADERSLVEMSVPGSAVRSWSASFLTIREMVALFESHV